MPNIQKIAAYSYIFGLLVFIYLPILIMMAMGLNSSADYVLPFQFSLIWYEKLMDNEIFAYYEVFANT